MIWNLSILLSLAVRGQCDPICAPGGALEHALFPGETGGHELLAAAGEGEAHVIGWEPAMSAC